MSTFNHLLMALCVFILLGCGSKETKTENQQAYPSFIKEEFPVIIYETEILKITQHSNHVFEHTSYLQSQDFGKVACNGMIAFHDNEAIILDTPADTLGSIELLTYIQLTQQATIKAVIPTHFHNDCVGGIEPFMNQNIPVYVNSLTQTIFKEKNVFFSKPMIAFSDSLKLMAGQHPLVVSFFGEGHTKDNVVAYFPAENTLFGGCLIKSLNSSKGNLEDANVNQWSETVRKIKAHYPTIEHVIPGHGSSGNADLLDYTIRLFEVNVQ